MKSEKIISKFLCCQFQDLYLCAHLKTNGRIVHLLGPQPCPRQNSCRAFACFTDSGACQARYPAGGARDRRETLRIGRAHENGSLPELKTYFANWDWRLYSGGVQDASHHVTGGRITEG